MKRKDLIKKLRNAGWGAVAEKRTFWDWISENPITAVMILRYQENRNGGGHAIYEKENGRPVQVPNHTEINENTARAILRAAGL